MRGGHTYFLEGHSVQKVWFNKTFSSIAEVIKLIRTADEAGRYHLISSNTKRLAPAFLESHSFMVEPSRLSGKEYVDWCLRTCVDHGVDIFVPGKEATMIAGRLPQFESVGTRVLSVASEENLHLLHDKARFCQAVRAPRSPPAEFVVFENIEDFNSGYAALRARHEVLCVKPSVSVYGIGFAVLDEQRSTAQLLLDGAQYRVSYEDFRRGLSQMDRVQPMLLMEYLQGDEYSVDCLADEGRLVCAVPRKKDVSLGYGQVIDVREDVIATVTDLAKDFRLNGIFNAQFKEGNSGLRLLEINPRMSGGIAMSCLAGPNLPYLALQGFDQGYRDLLIPDVRDGVRVYLAQHALELI